MVARGGFLPLLLCETFGALWRVSGEKDLSSGELLAGNYPLDPGGRRYAQLESVHSWPLCFWRFPSGWMLCAGRPDAGECVVRTFLGQCFRPAGRQRSDVNTDSAPATAFTHLRQNSPAASSLRRGRNSD